MKDHVICKQCGKSFKQLTYKHLKHHNLTTKQYCEKYQLSPGQLLSDSTRQLSKVTLSNMIKSYGQQQGTRRFDQYRKKQAYTNSLEYKQFKHNWTKEQFQQYNKSRAVTLQLCINRHGVQKGTQVFEKYCNKQAYAGNKMQYFVQKYGKTEGQKIYRQIGKQKAITLENMIRVHGQTIGIQVFNRWLNIQSKTGFGKSNISQQCFKEVSFKIGRNDLKFRENHGEQHFYINKKIYYVDLYDPATKRIIQFYGSYWHADPKWYEAKDEIPYPSNKNILAQQIWKRDQERLNVLIKQGAISQVLVIWENDYNNNKEQIIKRCIQFLRR